MSAHVALKIYGERNTGTNYLSELARQNLLVDLLAGRVPRSNLRTQITRNLRTLLPALADRLHESSRDRYFATTFEQNLGWKHMNPDPQRIGPQSLNDVRFLMVVKNPYSWALSLFRNPYHVGGRDRDFDIFLQRHLPVMEERENIGTTPLRPMEVWTRKMQGYLALRDVANHAYILRYEDLLVDDMAALTKAAHALSISIAPTPVPVEQGVKTIDRDKTRANYVDYYLNERWREKLTPQTVATINSQLDSDLMQTLGYEMLSA
ncbi:MAG: hypothetical protein ACPGSW_00180 [Phaeobacter italicus]